SRRPVRSPPRCRPSPAYDALSTETRQTGKSETRGGLEGADLFYVESGQDSEHAAGKAVAEAEAPLEVGVESQHHLVQIDPQASHPLARTRPILCGAGQGRFGFLREVVEGQGFAGHAWRAGHRVWVSMKRVRLRIENTARLKCGAILRTQRRIWRS